MDKLGLCQRMSLPFSINKVNGRYQNLVDKYSISTSTIILDGLEV